jgi:alpha-D-xyloside xylohydrolase
MEPKPFLKILLTFVCLLALPLFAAPIPVVTVKKASHGIIIQMKPGVMRLEVYSPRIIRVTYALQNNLPDLPSLAVISKPQRVQWSLREESNEIVLRTDEIQARVNRATGSISFFDNSGAMILAENLDGGKSLTPARIAGVETLRSRQEFDLAPGEALFGLGQHRNDLMNYRGATIRLQQRNPTESAVPVLVSSRGYGLFWDNPAITDVSIGAGEEQSTPALLTWTSEAADAIDYYFMEGPALDQVIADYRQLTGAVPMFGKWAWGFWQCKEHYATQQELLDVEQRYRAMDVPLDCVIQDWYYWAPHPWGSHQFDTNRYPDFSQLMRQLHSDHVHLIISVWGRFDGGSANWRELKNAAGLYSEVYSNFLVPGEFQYYDPFNPKARRIYWRQISQELFADGIDGWWLDASEPELSSHWGEFQDFKTALGPGFTVFNAYPLMHTTGIYRGQRADTSKKRVFILTRSAYAGQQRNAAVTWSGDIQGTWQELRMQIPAGLNFSISGIPYWNTDTGGFIGGDPADPQYAELFTRWFQFSAFCPMFRVHGTGHPKEMWRFDTNTENILIRYDRLRYHLIPYIYSTAWMVTSQGYTMMRPLVMDFPADPNVYNIGDQYLFGPSVMVCPVTRASALTRQVYLPAGSTWTDFWTGKKFTGGQTIETAAPIQTEPLFVRGGAIIPYGPEIEYAMEKSDPIELRVYRGSDGNFTLYEDEGDNYNYEKGVWATIPLKWDEAKQTLEIGRRQGSFPGMLKERTFNIVWVSENHGIGISSTENPDVVLHYTGEPLSVVCQSP